MDGWWVEGCDLSRVSGLEDVICLRLVGWWVEGCDLSQVGRSVGRLVGWLKRSRVGSGWWVGRLKDVTCVGLGLLG